MVSPNSLQIIMIIDNMKKSIILSLVFMLIACFSSLAAIKVNGIVVDSLSLEPEPMVTIRIMQQGNDTPVALVSGFLSFENICLRDY